MFLHDAVQRWFWYFWFFQMFRSMLYLAQKPPRQKSLTSQSKAYCQKYCSILASKASDPRRILCRACVLGDLCLSGQKDNQWWLWATADWLNHSDLHSNWSGTLQTRLQKQSKNRLHSPLCGFAAAEEGAQSPWSGYREQALLRMCPVLSWASWRCAQGVGKKISNIGED